MTNRFPFVLFLFCASVSQASAISAEDNLSCVNPYFTLAKHEEKVALPWSGAYYAMSAVPFVAGVLTQVALSQVFPKDRPYVNEIVNRVMTPINAALALPLVSPLSSRFQRWWFSQLKTLREEIIGDTSVALEARWHDTQATYGPNEQSMRSVYASITGKVSTNANRAKTAVSARDDKYAVEQIAEAAVSMRLLFGELAPNDPLVSMTMHMQFTNHAKIDEGFADRVRLVIVRYDSEISTSDAVRAYYDELLKEWLSL